MEVIIKMLDVEFIRYVNYHNTIALYKIAGTNIIIQVNNNDDFLQKLNIINKLEV
jgi:hypothetical protein